MSLALLVLNAGSSSLKFSLFAINQALQHVAYGQAAELNGKQPHLNIKDESGNILFAENYVEAEVEPRTWSLQLLLDWLANNLSQYKLVAIGHRVLHGGEIFTQPVMVDKAVIAQLKTLIPLGPLHQPHNIRPMQILLEQPLVQVACFDTAFHAAMPWQAQSYALPKNIAPVALKRYGFHGLSYEYIAQVLPHYLGESAANGKIIIAHLGQGASMCALINRKSIATTMGFTALEGLPMGTRCGSIDPGILLYLLAEQKMTADDLTDLLYNRSGLLGMSGISSDVRTLLQHASPTAKQALEYFTYRVQREMGSLAAALGGLDGLVFTGGIGENAASIRQQICEQASWLGIELDIMANESHQNKISTPASSVSVWVISTNEELIIAQHTWKLYQKTNPAVS